MERPQSIHDAAERAAAADAGDEVKGVLGDILANLRDVERQISARVTSLAAAVLATELAFASRIRSVSAFGFSIDDLSVLQRLAPILLAYLLFSLARLLSARRLLEAVHDVAFRHAYPGFSAAGLERLVTPPETLKLYGLIRAHVGGTKRTFLGVAGISAILMPTFLGPAYLVWTVARCAARSGATDPLTLLAGLVSAALIAQCLLLMSATVEAVGGPDRR